MSTRKDAARRPAAKATQTRRARPALDVAPVRKAARKPPAAAAVPDDASLNELLARLGRLELAGLAGRLVRGWRQDIEAIVAANRKSYDGLQQLVEQQVARVKERVGEIHSVVKVISVAGPKESARHLDDLAVASVEMALDDIRVLASAAAQSQREAFELVHQRLTANIDEVQRLLRK